MAWSLWLKMLLTKPYGCRYIDNYLTVDYNQIDAMEMYETFGGIVST